jgi:hypothetical protein
MAARPALSNLDAVKLKKLCPSVPAADKRLGPGIGPTRRLFLGRHFPLGYHKKNKMRRVDTNLSP